MTLNTYQLMQIFQVLGATKLRKTALVQSNNNKVNL